MEALLMDAIETENLYDFYKFKAQIFSQHTPGEHNSMAVNYMKLAENMKFPWMEKLKEEESPKTGKPKNLEQLPSKDRQEAERLIKLYREHEARKKAEKEAKETK